MNPTHQRRPRKAECVQWKLDNAADIIALFPDSQLHGGENIMIRHIHGIYTLNPGSWVVTGEDGKVRAYDDKTFKIKYEELK